MKTNIKLIEIAELGAGTELAIMKLALDSNDEVVRFTLTSTGMSLRVVSEHSTIELINLCDWLKKDSKNDENLRTNESEIRIFAKDKIKANREISKGLEL